MSSLSSIEPLNNERLNAFIDANGEIDIFLPWVDNSDLEWQKSLMRYTKKQTDETNAPARFRDMGTLRYVFRSIETNMPWVRYVHFVTAGHVPHWLNMSHPKLRHHTHNNIFNNSKHLPTFNSSAIEANIMGVKGLAENFIHFNDDMLVTRPVQKDDFFCNDLPRDFFMQNLPKEIFNQILFPNSIWIKSIVHTISVLNKHWPKHALSLLRSSKYFNEEYGLIGNLNNLFALMVPGYLSFKHFHHPQPYLLSTFQSVSKEIHTELEQTSSHRFRTSQDTSIYIFRYWQLATGQFVPTKKDDHATISIISQRDAEEAVKLLDEKCYVCINDDPELNDREYLRACAIIRDGLEAHFPKNSSFELDY